MGHIYEHQSFRLAVVKAAVVRMDKWIRTSSAKQQGSTGHTLSDTPPYLNQSSTFVAQHYSLKL